MEMAGKSKKDIRKIKIIFKLRIIISPF